MNFTQTLQISDCNDIPRIEFFKILCKGKKVLHIGCVDWPFVPEHNLHIALQDCTELCDGYDLNSDRYGMLEKYIKEGNELWVDLPYSEDTLYDFVLIPEVLEHVTNLEYFFENMNTINTKQYVITVPCAVQCGRRGHFAYDKDSEVFTEEVHPEHLAWYTPYTLKNAIQTYTDWKINSLFWLNEISVGVTCTK